MRGIQPIGVSYGNKSASSVKAGSNKYVISLRNGKLFWRVSVSVYTARVYSAIRLTEQFCMISKNFSGSFGKCAKPSQTLCDSSYSVRTRQVRKQCFHIRLSSFIFSKKASRLRWLSGMLCPFLSQMVPPSDFTKRLMAFMFTRNERWQRKNSGWVVSSIS